MILKGDWLLAFGSWYRSHELGVLPRAARGRFRTCSGRIEQAAKHPNHKDPTTMSTHSFSSPETENLKTLTAEIAEERREEEPQEESYADMKFVLDEPWRVKILPKQEPEKLPPGVLPKPEPFNPRQQPWRPGDVTRLKDDTPEGMMKYIATHTTGWWQEMAQRALRDTERAQRRAEEAGVQYGQYWTLELDAETKEKLRLAEEARRLRAEAERAKEEAAKEAFAQRQRELLEKAGRAPRCDYKYTDGRGCRAPQVRGERWCHGHAKMMSYRPERLELVPMEDEQSVAVNLYRVTKSLASGRITEKMAALMLWSVAIGAPGARRKTLSPQMNAERRRSEEARTKAFEGGNGAREREDFVCCRSASGSAPARSTRYARSGQAYGSEEETASQPTQPLSLIPPCGTRERTGLTSAAPNGAGALQMKVPTGFRAHSREGAIVEGVVNPGVTNAKSFVFGVDGGSTPAVSQTSAAEAAALSLPKRRPKGPFDSLRSLRAGSAPPRAIGTLSKGCKIHGGKGVWWSLALMQA